MKIKQEAKEQMKRLDIIKLICFYQFIKINGLCNSLLKKLNKQEAKE